MHVCCTFVIDARRFVSNVNFNFNDRDNEERVISSRAFYRDRRDISRCNKTPFIGTILITARVRTSRLISREFLLPEWVIISTFQLHQKYMATDKFERMGSYCVHICTYDTKILLEHLYSFEISLLLHRGLDYIWFCYMMKFERSIETIHNHKPLSIVSIRYRILGKIILNIWTVYFESGVSPFEARKYALFWLNLPKKKFIQSNYILINQ